MDKDVKVKSLTKRMLTITVDNGDKSKGKPPESIYFPPKAILTMKKKHFDSAGVQSLVRGGFLKVVADSKSAKKKNGGGS